MVTFLILDDEAEEPPPLEEQDDVVRDHSSIDEYVASTPPEEPEEVVSTTEREQAIDFHYITPSLSVSYNDNEESTDAKSTTVDFAEHRILYFIEPPAIVDDRVTKPTEDSDEPELISRSYFESLTTRRLQAEAEFYARTILRYAA